MSKKEESNGAPIPDQWYTLTLGSSYKDHHPHNPQPSPKISILRYDFLPASVDKSQPGSLRRRKDNKINVELRHVEPGKPKFAYEGVGDNDLKDNDAVLFFDRGTFRLERLHRSVKRLKHCRLPGESATAAALDPTASFLGRVHGKSQQSQHPVSNSRAAAVPAFTPSRPHQQLPPPPPPPPVSEDADRIGIGEDEQIDIGEDEQIDIGDVERIDIGETEQIDIGETEQIDIGETEQIDIGEVERIDIGETEQIDIGETEQIDIGEVERIDIGGAGISEGKLRSHEPANSTPSQPNATESPDFDLELEIMNDDDDDDAFGPSKNAAEETAFTKIDINLPHQNDTDDEIADVDVNDDNGVMGGNAAAALRAQVHKEEKEEQTSSSSASSGSESSASSSGSGSSHSSSSSDSSDGDSVNSI